MKLRFLLAAVIAAAATQATAGAFTADGVATGQSATEVVEFGADHRILNSNSTYSKFVMEDGTNPMSQLNGPCFGVIEIRGGAAEGGGVCVLDGLEGDRVLLGWTARRIDPRGQIAGYWTVNSGTGIWLKASGGGTFISTVNPANGAATNTIKGAVTLR